ncbi:hypothetical protein L6164_023090 [Bauhinia variegata]|uniref:Uncharacterized protein n=1 Tax=Bauhinia variegata TaxID=167791 RepID=A0ACB9MIP9_BAUVA|nr:hypothetical protein L6164_023090 [Bauhinia variegata]
MEFDEKKGVCQKKWFRFYDPLSPDNMLGFLNGFNKTFDIKESPYLFINCLGLPSEVPVFVNRTGLKRRIKAPSYPLNLFALADDPDFSISSMSRPPSPPIGFAKLPASANHPRVPIHRSLPFFLFLLSSLRGVSLLCSCSTILVLKMENRLTEELYGEILHLSKLEIGPTSADDQQKNLNDCDGDDLGLDDGSVWGSSDDELDKASELDREWQKRHDQFHTMGYRDGLIAGKEASAQEGFNIGFKRSVLTGYGFGHVRGITSAFAHLPEEIKEKLVETPEKRSEFQGLYESVHSLSTTDALRLFNEEIKANETQVQNNKMEASACVADSPEQTTKCYHLGNYSGQLESLIREFPAIDIQLPVQE